MEKRAFTQIRNEIYQSPYGETLNNSARWQRYNLDNLPLNEWQKILGYDANNLKHMRLTDFIAMAFVDTQNRSFPQYFTSDEKDLLRITANIHDLPESITGDINEDYKTQDSDDIEFRNMLLITQNIPMGIDRQTTKQVIDILKDKKSKLGKAFNAIEAIGYFKTSIKSWKKNQHLNPSQNSLYQLTNNVFSNKLSLLINYSSEYVLVNHALDRYKTEITQILNEMPPESFDLYSPSEKQEKLKQFETASVNWSNWLSQQV